jgi:hypothetical protein
MVASQARPAYIYDTTLGDWVPMSGLVDTGQSYTFTANQTFNGLVTANNGINAATTLSLQTGGINRMSIDSTGIMSNSFQPSWNVGITTQYSQPNNDFIRWDKSTGDGCFLSGGVSLGSYRVTVPKSGKYLVSVGLRSETGAGAGTGTELKINGVTHLRKYSTSGGDYVHLDIAPMVVNLAANDYLTVITNPSNGFAFSATVNTVNRFSGMMIA